MRKNKEIERRADSMRTPGDPGRARVDDGHGNASLGNQRRQTSIHFFSRAAGYAVDDALDLEPFHEIDEAFVADSDAVDKVLRPNETLIR